MARSNKRRKGKWHRIPEYVNAAGVKFVDLERDDGTIETRRVDELVAETFIGPCPLGYRLVHKDGDQGNCAAANLEYRIILN